MFTGFFFWIFFFVNLGIYWNWIECQLPVQLMCIWSKQLFYYDLAYKASTEYTVKTFNQIASNDKIFFVAHFIRIFDLNYFFNTYKSVSMINSLLYWLLVYFFFFYHFHCLSFHSHGYAISGSCNELVPSIQRRTWKSYGNCSNFDMLILNGIISHLIRLWRLRDASRYYSNIIQTLLWLIDVRLLILNKISFLIMNASAAIIWMFQYLSIYLYHSVVRTKCSMFMTKKNENKNCFE